MIQKSLSSGEPVRAGTDELIEALSSDASRAVLAACTREPRPVKAICERTGLASSTAYRHVNELVACGLLERTRTVVTAEGSRYDLYQAPFERLELLVDGDGVTLIVDGRAIGR